ncbi:MAG: hypothetical protein U0798_15235 [Gemmataceae bacterium]
MTVPSYPLWYSKWVECHLKTFGLLNTENCGTLLLWWPRFELLKPTEAELANATVLLLDQAQTLRKLADHFPSLKMVILSERQVAQTRAENAKRDQDTKPLHELFPKGISAEFERRCGTRN